MAYLLRSFAPVLGLFAIGGVACQPMMPSDAGTEPGETDGGQDGGTPWVPPDPTSAPSEAGEIVSEGAGGFLLRGVVLAPEGVLDPGEVLVEGTTITCVAESCSDEPGVESVTVIETNGVISPGLIDAHNHIAYNFLPEWVPEPMMLFGNRYEWADEQSYEDHVLPYTAHRSTGTHYCPAAKWGELRSLVHGTTTVLGQSAEQGCVNRLVRNADHFHGLGHDHMQTTISSPRDITDDQATTYVENFTAATNPTTRLAVHMGEGVFGDNVELEFASFAGRDTRNNRHAGVSLLEADDGSYSGTGLLIHSVAVDDEELDEIAATDGKIVWSPSSNLVLYGETANIARILDLGIDVAMGPDWTLSGEDNLLGEMRFALNWAGYEGVAQVTTQQLWQMATSGGAEVVGLAPAIGRLTAGSRADIAVFSRLGPDPYAAVVESSGRDVRLVLIDGEAYYGDLALESATAINGECDVLDACGQMKFLCVKNTPGADNREDEDLADLETQLVNILEGTGYPADEQYGRGDELLPLLDCAALDTQ